MLLVGFFYAYAPYPSPAGYNCLYCPVLLRLASKGCHQQPLGGRPHYDYCHHQHAWVIFTVDFGPVVNIILTVASIGTSIAVVRVPIFIEFAKFKVIVVTWYVPLSILQRKMSNTMLLRLVAAVIGDICITVSLTYHLVHWMRPVCDVQPLTTFN